MSASVHALIIAGSTPAVKEHHIPPSCCSTCTTTSICARGYRCVCTTGSNVERTAFDHSTRRLWSKKTRTDRLARGAAAPCRPTAPSQCPLGSWHGPAAPSAHAQCAQAPAVHTHIHTLPSALALHAQSRLAAPLPTPTLAPATHSQTCVETTQAPSTGTRAASGHLGGSHLHSAAQRETGSRKSLSSTHHKAVAAGSRLRKSGVGTPAD